jgi:hypothetical protein
MSESKDDSDAALRRAKPLAPPSVLFAVDGCVMGHCQDVVVIVWGIDVTPTLIEEYGKLLTHMASTHRLFSIVHIAPTLRGLPGGEIRAAFAAIAEEHVNALLLTAVLIVGSGFWSSAVRSVITSVQVLLRRKLNIRVCGSIDEVVTWLVPEHSGQTGRPLDGMQLRAAIVEMLDHPLVRRFAAALR